MFEETFWKLCQNHRLPGVRCSCVVCFVKEARWFYGCNNKGVIKMHVYMYTYMYIHTCTYKFVCIHTCIYIYIFMNESEVIYICVYVYKYIHVYIYIHMAMMVMIGDGKTSDDEWKSNDDYEHRPRSNSTLKTVVNEHAHHYSSNTCHDVLTFPCYNLKDVTWCKHPQWSVPH